jgi:hypothetical protein
MQNANLFYAILIQNTSASLKPGKKKSWYNALYPTYKSRADDFKKIFSALPQEEKLIVGKHNII